MLRKFFLTGIAALMFMALSSAAAYADPITLTAGQSTTYTFSSAQYPGVLATATVTFTGNQLTIKVTNLSTDGSYIDGIGLNTSPNLTVTNATFTGGMTDFKFSTGGGGLGNMEAVASSSKGKTTALAGNGTMGTAVFTLSTSLSSITIDQITIHVISLPNGQSIKLTGTPGPTAVPEPASLILLGTGLAGAAGAARKRRKARLAAKETE
jgi:hypothetical protein